MRVSSSPTPATGQYPCLWVKETGTAEIDGQVLLEIAQDDLEQAAQVLAFANGPGGLVEQTQTRELRAQLLFVTFTLGDISGDAKYGVDLTHRIPQGRFDRDIGMQPVGLRCRLFRRDGLILTGNPATSRSRKASAVSFANTSWSGLPENRLPRPKTKKICSNRQRLTRR